MAKLSVTCPPCGTVLSADSEEELVRRTQEHAQKEHGQAISSDEVRKAMRSQ